MKSFCVLNKPLRSEMSRAIGAASAVFGEKTGVAYGEGECARLIACELMQGIKSVGCTAMDFGVVNESRVAFLVRNYALSSILFVNNEGFVSVYNSAGKPLAGNEEKDMAHSISYIGSSESNQLFDESVCVNSDTAYLKALVNSAGDLEDISADIVCKNTDIKSMLVSVVSLCSGSFSKKPRFYVSFSGAFVCALDERSRMLTYETLYGICCALKIMEKCELTVPFSAPRSLDLLADTYGVRLNRCFDGGDLLWQNDSLFLVTELLGGMAKQGMCLASAYDMLGQQSFIRRNIGSDKCVNEIADIIKCDSLVTNGYGGVYARFERGEVLLTPCRNAGKYCMEISASDSETAKELAVTLEEMLST